jgi:hypothetical protein
VKGQRKPTRHAIGVKLRRALDRLLRVHVSVRFPSHNVAGLSRSQSLKQFERFKCAVK